MYTPGLMRMMRLAGGFRESRILLMANDLNLFSKISAGLNSINELASSLNLNRRSLRIIMDALVAMGFLSKASGEYRNTETAEKYLVLRSPDYKGNILKFMSVYWDHWSNLDNVLKTGSMNAPTPEQTDQSYNREYIWGMDNMGRERAEKAAQVLDLCSVKRMLDVGGGAATYSIAFAKKNLRLTSVVLDLPNTLEVARENIERNELGDRIRTWECSYWDADFKPEYDLVWISQIVHGLGEQQSQELVRRSSAALRPGGCLILHDGFLAEDGSSPYHAALFSVYMLAITREGRSYTVEEAKNWLSAAGLKDIRRIELDAESEMVAGIKP